MTEVFCFTKKPCVFSFKMRMNLNFFWAAPRGQASLPVGQAALQSFAALRLRSVSGKRIFTPILHEGLNLKIDAGLLIFV
jgi:hypothetical protein